MKFKKKVTWNIINASDSVVINLVDNRLRSMEVLCVNCVPKETRQCNVDRIIIMIVGAQIVFSQR